MTNVNVSMGQGHSESFVRSLINKSLVIAVALGVLALPATSQARGLSQHEYVQWLAQLAGDSGKIGDSSEADLVNWARGKGIEPRGGWNLSGNVSRDVLAQTIAQFLALNPGKNGDYAKILARHGIILPDSATISRRQLATFIDDHVQPRAVVYRSSTTPGKPKGNNGRGNGEDPPPPGWVKNHPGRPQNDGPGTDPNGRGFSNGRKN